MQARFSKLGIVDRVRRFDAVRSPADARIGRILSHRRILQEAAERGLRSVLVIEDETLFLDRSDAILACATRALRDRPWKLLHLGTWRGCDGLAIEAGCAHLAPAAARVGPHAIAYGAAGFDEILARLPMSFGAMADFLGADRAIDDVLAAVDASWVVCPAIATVPISLPYQEPADQLRFVA